MGSLDVVNAAVNLAYIPEKHGRELEYNPEYFIKHSYDKVNAAEKPMSSIN